MGLLKCKVYSGEPATDELQTAIAQEVGRMPAAQTGRSVTHLKGVRLPVVMKHATMSIRSRRLKRLPSTAALNQLWFMCFAILLRIVVNVATLLL